MYKSGSCKIQVDHLPQAHYHTSMQLHDNRYQHSTRKSTQTVSIPPKSKMVSILCLRSINFSRLSDRPSVCRTSRAFRCALCGGQACASQAVCLTAGN